MKEKKLTDEEIVKALDICYNSPCCNADCPYFNKNGRNLCVENKALYRDMKRIAEEYVKQKAEIERLTEEKTNISQSYIEVCDVNAKLTQENDKLQKQVDELTEERENMQAVIFGLGEEKRQLQKRLDDKKAEEGEIYEWAKKNMLFGGA